MKLKHKLFSSINPNSKANQFRKKRFDLFLAVFEEIINNQKRVNILDVGGWEIFWINMGIQNYPNIHVHLLNLDKQITTLPNIGSTVGDGCSMSQFQEDQFDIVFSNSVIEHVGDFNRQKQFAEEVQRVGKNYFVQTPNYFFPVEPHFMFIGFHWLPLKVRVFLVRHFNLGWYKKIQNFTTALNFIKDIQLLKLTELVKLFPNAKIFKEKYFFMTKSFVLYKDPTYS